MNETEIILQAGDTQLPAVLNNSTPAKELMVMLPLTLKLQKYAHDFCGVMEALPYKQEELRSGWTNGDLAFAADGNYFAILYKDQEISHQYDNMVTLGRLTVPPMVMDTLGSEITVTIAIKK